MGPQRVIRPRSPCKDPGHQRSAAALPAAQQTVHVRIGKVTLCLTPARGLWDVGVAPSEPCPAPPPRSLLACAGVCCGRSSNPDGIRSPGFRQPWK